MEPFDPPEYSPPSYEEAKYYNVDFYIYSCVYSKEVIQQFLVIGKKTVNNLQIEF